MLVDGVIHIMVETGLGHLGHVLSRSSGSDPFYIIPGSDLDSVLNHVCLITMSGPDQSNKLSALDSDDHLILLKIFQELIVQLEYFDHFMLG